MPSRRDSLSRIRTSAGTVRQAFQARGRSGEPGTVYARARLHTAEITEIYSVEQEISVSPSETTGEDPAGKIELTVPYDGCQYLTRQAMEDVSCGTVRHSRGDGRAVVGHLLLHDYGRTGLGDSLGLPDRHGSVPVEVLVDGADPDRLDQLCADYQTCATCYQFQPQAPEVHPVRLEVDLYDPDSLDLVPLDLMRLSPLSDDALRRIGDIIGKLRQQVSFRNNLLLQLVVHLTVRTKPELQDMPIANVARITIGWPTITSLRTLSLHTLDTRHDNEEVRQVPVRYNPENTCLEWEHVPMFARRRKAGDEHVHYQSHVMFLSIQHPGELYQQDQLEVRAEVKIPGYLLSGLEARLYDATGQLAANQPKRATRLDAHATLMLDDAFARRDFTPSQQLFFDEIIPDDMRITDIRSALDERGFTVWPDTAARLPGSTSDVVRWFLAARRQEGPDTMDLWIFVEGRHFETVEETVAVGGGKTNTTRRQSGDLQVFIRGRLARDSKELTQEMNALQQKLRERYGRVRARR